MSAQMTGETESSRRQQEDGTGTASGRQPTRRQVLAAGATTAAAAVAGCESITEQSFEASPVTLPEDSRETLQLQELVAESQTINREAGGAEITITNNVAVYSRESWLAAEGE